MRLGSRCRPRRFSAAQRASIAATFLKAYRWQYIVSGVMQPRFQKVLFGTMSPHRWSA
jgi:hypothetical protein